MNWFSLIERISIFYGIGKNAGCLSIAKIEICTLQNPLTAQMCPYDGWFEHKGRTKENGTLISFARKIGVFPLPQFEWFTGQKCFRIKFFLYKEKHKSDGGGQIWFFPYIDKIEIFIANQMQIICFLEETVTKHDQIVQKIHVGLLKSSTLSYRIWRILASEDLCTNRNSHIDTHQYKQDYHLSISQKWGYPCPRVLNIPQICKWGILDESKCAPREWQFTFP